MWYAWNPRRGRVNSVAQHANQDSMLFYIAKVQNGSKSQNSINTLSAKDMEAWTVGQGAGITIQQTYKG